VQQQLEPQRRAQELRQVGGHGHQSLTPHISQTTGREEWSRHTYGRFRPVAMPSGRERLHQHRRQVAGHDHPYQEVVELRAWMFVAKLPGSM